MCTFCTAHIGGTLPLSYYKLLHDGQVETVEGPELGTGPVVNPNTLNRPNAWPLSMKSNMDKDMQVRMILTQKFC